MPERKTFQWLSLRSGIRGDNQYLETIDVLRGWAILLVFVFHAWGISGGGESKSSGSFLLSYIEAGRTGVTLFFVLSGFLLSLPWFDSINSPSHSAISLKNYYLARFLRIVPLYYFAILIACLLTGEWQVGLQAALFQFVAFEIFPFSVVWWTLATEMQFYLILPLMMWLLLGGRFGRALLWALLLAWLWFYVTEVVWNPEGERLRSYFLTKSLFGRMPAFLTGIAAAWVYLRLLSSSLIESPKFRLTRAFIVILSLLVLEMVLYRSVVLGDWESEANWHIHHTYEAMLWGIVLLMCVLPNPRRLFAGGRLALAYLGKLSYSFYMCHVPVLFYLIYPVKERLGDSYMGSHWFYVIPFIAFVLSVILSLASYRWIELPGLNLKRHLPMMRRGKT